MGFKYKDLTIEFSRTLTNILDLRIDKGFNQHSRLYLSGLVPESEKESYAVKIDLSDQIKIKDEDNVLFCGAVDTFTIKMVNEVYYFEMEAISYSYVFDVTKRSRSFQDLSMTYKDILNEVMAGYPSAQYRDTVTKGKVIEDIIVQYKETDWELILRIASHFGASVVVNDKEAIPRFYFGLPIRKTASDLDEDPYTVSKDLAEYIKTAVNFKADFSKFDAAKYEIETRNYLDLGRRVTYRQIPLIITKSESYIYKEELLHLYSITTEKGAGQSFQENTNIYGARLDGVIKEIKRNCIRIHLDIDEVYRGSDNKWVPYAGGVNNEVGYYMPTLGSAVQMYFPNGHEGDSVISASVRRGAAGHDRMDDHREKHLRNEFGKELRLGPNDMEITTGNDNITIDMTEDGIVTMNSPKKIYILTDDKMKMGKLDELETDVSWVTIPGSTAKTINISAGKNINFNVGGSGFHFIAMDEVNDVFHDAFDYVDYIGFEKGPPGKDFTDEIAEMEANDARELENRHDQLIQQEKERRAAIEAAEREARAQIVNGIASVALGVLAIIGAKAAIKVAVAATAVSFGAAAPLLVVAGAATVAAVSSTVTATMELSNIVEGATALANLERGDLSGGYNPLRELMGDELFESVLTVSQYVTNIAMILTGVGGLVYAAKRVGVKGIVRVSLDGFTRSIKEGGCWKWNLLKGFASGARDAAVSQFTYDLIEGQWSCPSEYARGMLISGATSAVISFARGEPVDVVSGTVFHDLVDFEYPGPIPLKWVRSWYSWNIRQLGPFGYGSSSLYGMHIQRGRYIVFVNDKGREIEFALIEPDTEVFNRKEQLTLNYTGEEYKIFDHRQRLSYVFKQKLGTELFQLHQMRDDARDMSVSLEYDRQSYLSRLVDSCGRAFEIETDTSGLITCVRYNDVPLVEYAYDENLNLISVIDVNGNKSSIFYENHLMVKRITLGGSEFHWEYAGEGPHAKCVHTWGDGGLLECRFQYNDGHTVYTDSLGHKTLFYYNENMKPTRTVYENGRVDRYRYNEFDETVAYINGDGEKTTYAHNDSGKVTEVTQPNGGVHKFEYNDQGLITKRITPLGAESFREYDESGKLLSVTMPNGLQAVYQYKDGMVSSIVEGEGENARKIEFLYDRHKNLTKLVYPNGAVTQREFDDHGNCLKLINPLGAAQTMAYDQANRLVRLTEADGNVTQLKYNVYADVTWMKDKLREVSYTYTALGKIASRTELDRKIQMLYDTEGRLIQVVNEIGEKYLFERDCTGKLISETGYDGVQKKYEYSPAGKLTGIKRGKKADWINMAYDSGGALSKITYPNGEEEIFTFGIMGELLAAENKNAKLSFEYDNLGNLLKESQDDHYIESQYPMGNDIGIAGVTSMTSGRVGFQSSMGLEVDIHRDKFGQVEGMSAVFQDTTAWKSQMAYNMLGQVEERVLNGAVKDEWSYDQQGRPLSQRVSCNRRENSYRKYQWDTEDQLRSIVDSISHMSLSYSYDSYGILESETCHGVRTLDKPYLRQTIRKLDDSGNVYETINKASRRYGKGGQLESISSRQYSEIPEHLLGTTYRYNDCGEMVEKRESNGKKWRYIYHPDGLLEKVIRPDGQELCFAYDPLGRRVSKSFDGKTTRFLWDRNKILHEWVESKGEKAKDNASSSFAWIFNDNSFTPLAKLTNGQSYSAICDHLGTPNVLLNREGEVVWKCYFDIYGRARVKGGGKTEEENCSFRFPGQYEDAETGLYYNRFRYYMPDEGIYTQRDPIGLAGGNPTVYGYVWFTLAEIDLFGLSDDWRWLFRGTSIGYPGNQNHVRNAMTPTSTDPRVSTAFAAEARRHGPGIVYIATRDDLSGVDILGLNKFSYELEVGIGITPTEFANLASIAIPVDDAIALLRDMGIDVPSHIRSPEKLGEYLRESSPMTQNQIEDFVTRASPEPEGPRDVC